MKQEVASFLDYVAHSPTVFQATQQACDMLDAAGFTRLSEHEAWEILPGGRYYVTRNRSALVAFAVPTLIVVCYGQTFGWNSSFILIMIFCAVSALFLFLVSCFGAEAPLLHLRNLRIKGVGLAVMAALLLVISHVGMRIQMILFMRNVLGYPL